MKLRSQIDSVLEKALVLIMSLMVVNVLWQVFSRYLLANPSSFTDELARYLMIWVGVLGAAYVAGKGNHVAITYFSEKFSVSNFKRVKLLINLFIMGFAFLGMFFWWFTFGIYNLNIRTTFTFSQDPSWTSLCCNTLEWYIDYFLQSFRFKKHAL